MSSFFTIDRKDLLKGFIVAIIGVVLTSLQQGLTDHGLDFAAYDWKFIAEVAVSTGAAYLSKNLFTTADGRFMGIIKV